MDTDRVQEIIDRLTAIKDHPNTSAQEAQACDAKIKELKNKYNIPDPLPNHHPYLPPNWEYMSYNDFLDMIYSPFGNRGMSGHIVIVRQDNIGKESPFDIPFPRVTVWPTPNTDPMDMDDSIDPDYLWAPEEDDEDEPT